MPDRLTILMQNTTNPENATNASSHIGGWSESFYHADSLVAGDTRILDVLNKRSLLLPKTARIVGYRIGKFTISGNKLIPQGTQTVRYSLVGNISQETDLPNISLMFSATGSGVPNASRFAARCIPDLQVKFGEYQPESYFTGWVTQYRNALTSNAFGFIGRQLDALSNPIVSIHAGSITVGPDGTMPGTGSYVRFFRAKDDYRYPIEGAYQVLTSNGTTRIITLLGFDPSTEMTIGNGLLRRDIVQFYTFGTVNVNRVVVRKVGRPFENYRGRRSNRAR